jgi:uncharacterized repeat protein (TIGR03803 family)
MAVGVRRCYGVVANALNPVETSSVDTRAFLWRIGPAFCWAAIASIVTAGCSGRASSALPFATVSATSAADSSALKARVGAGEETVLHSFGAAGDGAGPGFGVITDASGRLYGTTIFGGTKEAGAGTVFRLTPGASGYNESLLYSFGGGRDGEGPFGGLAMDGRGALYGVTLVGGNKGCDAGGCGLVFKLTPRKSGSGYVESTLYRFANTGDADQPVGTPVLDKSGDLYGATQFGGIANDGAVFKLTPDSDAASGYAERVIYSLPGGAGGYLPQSGLAIDEHGALYGETQYGGNLSACSGGCGVIFKLTPSGSTYVANVIHAFGARPDGQQPMAAVTVDNATGKVFGTTEYGGTFYGTAFELTPSGSGYTERVLHNFGRRGTQLDTGPLLLAAHGDLYGAVNQHGGGCGTVGCGSVFELVKSGSGYSYQVLLNFRNALHGAEPESAALIMGDGALYGTTRSGGTETGCGDGGPGGALGCGVVFKLVP